ncbi:hypothetical protein C922_00460 [Plasmodium inui San Antonio 1]|uniref:Uncharacterized protein n=1 Tax=Plasmodium inui San Antonio 1 TaxID=1237626 RepID=W7A6M6_9APIC|nr:hypothetical protein C922_00460 [Plasmodium inui San Antonio 1]EUD68772.1 hypothetical protein C922_00460 [Plasmodium inui San Antonio 1]
MVDDKYVQMLLSKYVEAKNREDKKCEAWEEKGKTNKYILHLQKLYKEFKLEECLNYGLENMEKLEEKDYVGKIEFLKIIGNVYFQLENYKYSSLTYILMSKYLNKVSDGYKVEICYNAGVSFIRYFLQSNDISYYLSAKTSFHCSMLYNEKGSRYFNPMIYENTVGILRRHFPLGVKEQTKKVDEQNRLFSNSSFENIFLDSDTDLASSSDAKSEASGREAKDFQGEDSKTKEFFSLVESKVCTLKREKHKVDGGAKGGKGKNQKGEEDVYFDSNNTETFPIYDDTVDMRNFVLRKSDALAKLQGEAALLDEKKMATMPQKKNVALPEEKRTPTGRSTPNIQLKEDRQSKKVLSDHNLVNVSNERSNQTSNYCNNLKNILFKNRVNSSLKNFPSPIVKSKSSSLLKSTSGSILKSSSHNILKKWPGSIISSSPVNSISQPTRDIPRSSSSNFFNNTTRGNAFFGLPKSMMRCNEDNIMRSIVGNIVRSSEDNILRSSQGNFVNNASPQFLNKHSSCNFPPNTPRFLPCHSIHIAAMNSPISFSNNQRIVLKNNTSPIFANSFVCKRMSQQKSILKCMRRSTDERIDQESPKTLSNSNECRGVNLMPPNENDLLQHKRRKINEENPLSGSCENGVGVGSDIFLRAKDNKMCTFDYCNVEEREGISDNVGCGAKGGVLLDKAKPGNIREEAQKGKLHRGRTRGVKAVKDAMEKGEVEEGQIQGVTVTREKPRRENIKGGKTKRDKAKSVNQKRDKDKKTKARKAKERRAKARRLSALFDKLFSNEYLNGSVLNKVKSACKEYQSRLIREYYHIYHLKNKKKKVKQIIKRKRIADLFHDLYEICKKNKHDFLMKFVDQDTRSKGASNARASRQGGVRKRMLTNDKGTPTREETECCTRGIRPHEDNSNLKMLDKGKVSREGSRKGSLLIPVAGGRGHSVKQQERGDAPHSLRNYEEETVHILEMNCVEKGGHKKELQYEQRNQVERQNRNPFHLSRFVNLYSQIRSIHNHARGGKYQKEKKEIEEVIILSIKKINKKRIRDKVKKLSSYNNSILYNIGDKFIDDMDELFLIKNYAKILKSIKRNDSIRHIYYLYENMYAIDKFDHINGSNFFNISHFIIDILLLEEIKQKDYLKKKIHKMKYSYQNYYAIYDDTHSGALFKDLLRHLFNPRIKDTVKGDPKTLSRHIMRTKYPQQSLNSLPLLSKDKRKEADLKEQNDAYINVKFSSTTTVNNSDTNSYTNQKKEELLVDRINEMLPGERHRSAQASGAGTNSCLSLKNNVSGVVNESGANEDDVKEGHVKSGTSNTSDTTDRNKPIFLDFLSMSSRSQHGESRDSSISYMTHTYKCEMEKMYLEMGKEDREILDVEKFYEHMNVSSASNDEGRAKVEEVVLMLFYYYCDGGGGGDSSVSSDLRDSGERAAECTIRRALFKIFFFFTSNGIINKKNLHEYVTFLRLYHFYLASIKCDPFIYFYHDIEKDSEKIVHSMNGKNVMHQDFTTHFMLDNYLNVIHCHLYMLKLLHKSYLNKLKRKHSYDKVNLESMINDTFSILNCLLIKYSYDEEARVVRRRVVFLFLHFLYLNSKYYFRNVTFFLHNYDINYLVKSETGNFCKVNADLERMHSIYEKPRRSGPKVNGDRTGEAHQGHKEMGEENVMEEELLRKRPYKHEEQKGHRHSGQANEKQGDIPGEEEKQSSSEEDGILDNQGDAEEEEPQERGRTCKESFGENRENQGNKKDPFVNEKEWRNELVSKKGQPRKRKSTTHNSSMSNMKKFKNVFTKLDQNIDIAFSSFLKCYHKCFFILNLQLHENDMFRRIVWKIAQRIVGYCNDLYTILKIKKIPISSSFDYVFDEINHSLYSKNIFLKPSFFKVLREDNYVRRIYSVYKNYIGKGWRRQVACHGIRDVDQNNVLNILINFAKLNRGGYQREKMNKEKKQFIFLVHTYRYIKKCICKELKQNSILSLYKKAKDRDENFSQSIDYLHSLFDTRLCMLSLDFELQNIIIEFLNHCMEFIKQYDKEQDPRFVIINKMMNVYSCVFSLFYLRLNCFSECHTNKLSKILAIQKNIFSYDDQPIWHMLNVFNFVNFRYGCSYRFLNTIFTSFHVLVNMLVKIDVHVEMDRKRIRRGRCKWGTQIISARSTYRNATRLHNYEQVQKTIEREKRKNVRNKGVLQSVGGVRFGKGIIYKIVKEVKKKVAVSGKLKIKNSILENIIGKRMNRYFVNPLGGEIGMNKLERRMGEMCNGKGTKGVGIVLGSTFSSSFGGTFSWEEKGHRGGYSSDPLSAIHAESQVETIAAADRCASSKSKIVMKAMGGKFQMSQFKHGSPKQRILQSYGKLKKIKKKLKRKINNLCYFKYISVINKSQNKIYTTISRTYAHIIFILISILHIENYNILHLKKNQDFFMNNDIYNTYYLFLHISSSIILLLSSVLKTYLHFNPTVRLDKREFIRPKLGQTKGMIGIAKRGKSVPCVRDEHGMHIGMANKEGDHRPRQHHLSEDRSASKKCRSASIGNHTSGHNVGKFRIGQKEKESTRGYQIYLQTLLKFSSMNVLLMSKKKLNKRNKMKKNKYIFIFCNLMENLLQNSMFFVDLFNNCKNRNVLEMNDVFSKLTKLCKENNIMDDFAQIKKELIYHTLFKYILPEEYINHFNMDKNELYNTNKCSLNLFYFSLNILLTNFNTDISIHLERSLLNIHHFNHDNLYYEFILNNVKRTIRYIRESSKSSFNCIVACVLYYLSRWKKGGGKILKGKNSEEKNILFRRNISNQRFSSSYSMEEVKGGLFFNLFSKEECTNDTVLRGSVTNNWKDKGDSHPKYCIHPGEDSYGIFQTHERIPPRNDKPVRKLVGKHLDRHISKHVGKPLEKLLEGHLEKQITHLKAHRRNERKILSKLVYDIISPYLDIKHINVYNKIYRNHHGINSLINICFSFLFNSFLFLKPVYPFDIFSKEKSENESCGKKIRTTNYTLDIFSMKMSDIKAVELFLSLYIHKYMQSICLDVKKLVDYNTYMNQFFWVSNGRSVSVALPRSDYAYLNYAARNVYYTFNDYNVLQFLINFKRSKSEGKEFMMSFVKVFERMISLDDEISAYYTDPLTYNVYLDYLNDLFLNDDYYYVCFYEYIKNVYLEYYEGEFEIENLDCYIKEINEINPYKIKKEMKRKFDEYVEKNYLLLTVRRSRRSRSGIRGKRRKITSCDNQTEQAGKGIGEMKKLIGTGEEKIRIVLNNNPYHFKNVYRAYRNRLFSLLNKKNINYLELIKVLNKKQYHHFSNMFYSSFIHILSEVKYDYNKQYNFNISKIMDKLNIGLKASFYNNKNVLLYYYTFQQYFHLYKFLEDKYFSEFLLPEYILLNITSKSVNNVLYNTKLYRIYSFLKFLYLRNVLKHTDILLNFLLYVYYKYFLYHYRGKDEFSHHFIDLFLSIHEESYNNSLLVTELKATDRCLENSLLNRGSLLSKYPLLGEIPVSAAVQGGSPGEGIGTEAEERDGTNDEIIAPDGKYNDENHTLKGTSQTQSAYQEINNYHLVLSNSQNRFIHLLFFKILTNCVKSKINILNAKNLFNNLNFFISSYVKYSLFYTFEERNKAFLDSLRHKYSFYNFHAVKKNLKLCVYLKNVYLKRDLFNSDILSFLNIECTVKRPHSSGELSKKTKKERYANFGAPQSMNKQFGTSQILEHVREGEQHSPESLLRCGGLPCRNDETSNRKRTIGEKEKHLHGVKGRSKNEMNKKKKLLSGEARSMRGDVEANREEPPRGNHVAGILKNGENQIVGAKTIRVKREVEENYANVERTNQVAPFQSEKKKKKQEDQKSNPREGQGPHDQIFPLNSLKDAKKGSHTREDIHGNQIKVKKEELSDGNDTKVSINSLTKADVLRKEFFKKRNSKKISKKYYINILKFYLANRAQGYSLNYAECQKLEDKSIYLVSLFLGKIFQFLFNSLLWQSCRQSGEDKNDNKRERDMVADMMDASEWPASSYTYERLLLYFMLITMCHYADSLIFLSLHFLDLHQIGSRQSFTLQDNSQESSSQKSTLQKPYSANHENAALSPKEELNRYNLTGEQERNKPGEWNQEGNRNQNETYDSHMKKLNYCEKLRVDRTPRKQQYSSNNKQNGCENHFEKQNLILKPSLTSTSSYYMCRNEAIYIMNGDKESTQMIIPLYKLLVTRLKICLYYPRYFFLASLFSYKYDTRLSDDLLDHVKDLNLSEGVKYYTYDVNNNDKGYVSTPDGDCNGDVAKSCSMVEELNTGEQAVHLGDHSPSGINRDESNDEGNEANEANETNETNEANLSRKISDPLDEADMLEHNSKNNSGTYNGHAKNVTLAFRKKKQNFYMCVNYYTDYHENGNSNNCSFPSLHTSSNSMEYEDEKIDMELAEGGRNGRKHVKQNSVRKDVTGEVTKQEQRDHVGITPSHDTYERELDEKDMNQFNYDVHKLKVVIKNIEIRYEDVLNDIVEGLNFIAENKNCGNYNSQAAYHLCIYYFMRKNYTKCIHYMKFFINKGNFKIWQNDSFNQDYYCLYCKRVQRSEFIFIKYFTIVLEVSKNVLKNVLSNIYEEMLRENGNVAGGKRFTGRNSPFVDGPHHADDAFRTDDFPCAHLGKFLVDEKVLDIFKEGKKEEAPFETPVKSADKRKTNEHKTDESKTEESKTEESKTDESKTDESKTDEPKTEESKTDEPKTEESKTDEPKTEESKTDESKTDESKTDEPKTEESKTDEPKTEESKTDEPKTEESKTDEPKTEESKTDEPKTEESKTDEPKTEESKTDEPKTEESKTDGRNTKETEEINVNECKSSLNKENANDKERPILNDIKSDINDPDEVAETAEAVKAEEAAKAVEAGNSMPNDKENKLEEIENKWIYLGYDHLDHLNEIYDILKILFEIYVYIGKTIKRFNDYKVLEEATVVYGSNISVINVLFKIITEHICFIFEVLCYFTPHILVHPIILLFASNAMMTSTVSGGSSEKVTETPSRSSTPVSRKYTYLKRASNNEELICNRSSASLDLRIFKLFREFLANKSATMPTSQSTRMHSVFQMTCKKVMYYQKSEKDIIKNLSAYNKKGNKKKREGVIKFVDNALNKGNKTNLSEFLNLFKNEKLLNCTNYLNCENIKFLTRKLSYNSSCKDINKRTQLIHLDNNSVEKATPQVDKENTICTANDMGNDLPAEVNTSVKSNNDSMDEYRSREWVLYHIKLASGKHIFLYDDYDIFNNIKTKTEALNCVNSMLSDKNSATKKGETSNQKKRKSTDSTMTDVRNSVRDRDLRRLNRERSKVV